MPAQVANVNSLAVRTTLGLVTIALLAPAIAAQNTTNQTGGRTAPSAPQGWSEQANEFGVGQAVFQDLIDGEPRPFEARFYLNTHYPEKGVTYFLFAVVTKQTPLTASFDALVDGSTGADIPVYKRDTAEGGTVIQWFVDGANMPAPGTPIVVRATIGSTGEGQYQAGALVQPFNYKWEPVNMASGTPASLYVGTQYGINRATESGCTGKLCELPVVKGAPAPAAFGVALALAAAAFVVRRRFP